MIASKLMMLLAAASILERVATSTTPNDMDKEMAIAEGESRAHLFQQRLLVGAAHDAPMDEQFFVDQLKQSSRRTYAVNCTLEQGQVNFFDITVQITPSQSFQQSCLLADQIVLGNDINVILLNYGVGESGAYDDAAFIAGVCPAPTQTTRRRLVTTGFLWKGTGGCRPGMCSSDNADARMLSSTSGVREVDGGQRNLASSWFTSTFKPQMEATLESAFATELVPLHRGCLGFNPVIDVTITGSTLLELAALRCPLTGTQALPVTHLGNIFVSLAHSKCQTCVKIDFNTKGNGEKLTRGAYVSKEWYDKYGLTITATGGYSPNNQARIFDTSNPGTHSDGDPDLGSPNQKCPGGGPGQGRAGEPGMPGENCKALGNVLIVNEHNSPIPDDNALGGRLTFEFTKPVLFSDIGMIDIKVDDRQKMIFTYEGGKVETFTYRSVDDDGDNGVTRVIANKRNVRKLDLIISSNGGVVELNFCPSCFV